MNKYVVEKKLGEEQKSEEFNNPDAAVERTFALIRELRDPYTTEPENPTDAEVFINRAILRGKNKRKVGYIKCRVIKENVNYA